MRAPTQLQQQHMSGGTAGNWESLGVAPALASSRKPGAYALATPLVGRWNQIESQFTGDEGYIYQGLQSVINFTSSHADFAFFTAISNALTASDQYTHLPPPTRATSHS
jgi:hypothetical protein